MKIGEQIAPLAPSSNIRSNSSLENGHPPLMHSAAGMAARAPLVITACRMQSIIAAYAPPPRPRRHRSRCCDLALLPRRRCRAEVLPLAGEEGCQEEGRTLWIWRAKIHQASRLAFSRAVTLDPCARQREESSMYNAIYSRHRIWEHARSSSPCEATSIVSLLVECGGPRCFLQNSLAYRRVVHVLYFLRFSIQEQP